VRYVGKQKQPVSPSKIAKALQLNPNTVRRTCQELYEDESLAKGGRGKYQAKDRAENRSISDKPVTFTGRKTCTQFVMDWLSSGHLGYISSDIVVKEGKFKRGTARNSLSRLCRNGAIARYAKGLYALDRSVSDKKPRGVSKASRPRFARTHEVGGVRRVEVWDLLKPEDFAMHDLCFTLHENVRDNAPYMWCEGNGALSFRFNAKNRFYVSNETWNATHCLGRDPLRPVKVNVWRDSFQIIFEARNKPVLPTEIMSVVAHLGWILREIHSTKSFEDLDHYQSHVGKDYPHAMEVSGPAYRMSVRDFFGRMLTWYVTSLKQADGSMVDVERHEAIDAHKMSAKDWALFRTDPLTALMGAIGNLEAGISDSSKSNENVVNGLVEAQKANADSLAVVTEKLDVLRMGGMTIQQEISKLADVSLIQAGNVNRLVEALERYFSRPSLFGRFANWVRSRI